MDNPYILRSMYVYNLYIDDLYIYMLLPILLYVSLLWESVLLDFHWYQVVIHYFLYVYMCVSCSY